MAHTRCFGIRQARFKNLRWPAILLLKQEVALGLDPDVVQAEPGGQHPQLGRELGGGVLGGTVLLP